MILLSCALAMLGAGKNSSLERLERIADQAANVTVQIMTSDFSGEKWSLKIGAGTIIDSSGLIVTCSHVLGTHYKVRVRLVDNKVFAAEVIGRFPEHDLAILRFNAPPDVIVAPKIHDRLIAPGTEAVCSGFPKGVRDMCSAEVGQYGLAQERFPVVAGTPVIGFRGDVEPGYSGGPLLDLDGGVIGVVIAKSRRVPGEAIAVPASVVRKHIADLEKSK